MLIEQIDTILKYENEVALYNKRYFSSSAPVKPNLFTASTDVGMNESNKIVPYILTLEDVFFADAAIFEIPYIKSIENFRSYKEYTVVYVLIFTTLFNTGRMAIQNKAWKRHVLASLQNIWMSTELDERVISERSESNLKDAKLNMLFDQYPLLRTIRATQPA
jgi:hypothetical protein